MAGITLADTLQRVVREQWRMNLMLGFSQRTGQDGAVIGRLAKASGATQLQVRAWMAGEAQPTTAQALAVLDALPEPKAVAA